MNCRLEIEKINKRNIKVNGVEYTVIYNGDEAIDVIIEGNGELDEFITTFNNKKYVGDINVIKKELRQLLREKYTTSSDKTLDEEIEGILDLIDINGNKDYIVKSLNERDRIINNMLKVNEIDFTMNAEQIEKFNKLLNLVLFGYCINENKYVSLDEGKGLDLFYDLYYEIMDVIGENIYGSTQMELIEIINEKMYELTMGDYKVDKKSISLITKDFIKQRVDDVKRTLENNCVSNPVVDDKKTGKDTNLSFFNKIKRNAGELMAKFKNLLFEDEYEVLKKYLRALDEEKKIGQDSISKLILIASKSRRDLKLKYGDNFDTSIQDAFYDNLMISSYLGASMKKVSNSLDSIIEYLCTNGEVTNEEEKNKLRELRSKYKNLSDLEFRSKLLGDFFNDHNTSYKSLLNYISNRVKDKSLSDLASISVNNRLFDILSDAGISETSKKQIINLVKDISNGIHKIITDDFNSKYDLENILTIFEVYKKMDDDILKSLFNDIIDFSISFAYFKKEIESNEYGESLISIVNILKEVGEPTPKKIEEIKNKYPNVGLYFTDAIFYDEGFKRLSNEIYNLYSILGREGDISDKYLSNIRGDYLINLYNDFRLYTSKYRKDISIVGEIETNKDLDDLEKRKREVIKKYNILTNASYLLIDLVSLLGIEDGTIDLHNIKDLNTYILNLASQTEFTALEQNLQKHFQNIIDVIDLIEKKIETISPKNKKYIDNVKQLLLTSNIQVNNLEGNILAIRYNLQSVIDDLILKNLEIDVYNYVDYLILEINNLLVSNISPSQYEKLGAVSSGYFQHLEKLKQLIEEVNSQLKQNRNVNIDILKGYFEAIDDTLYLLKTFDIENNLTNDRIIDNKLIAIHQRITERYQDINSFMVSIVNDFERARREQVGLVDKFNELLKSQIKESDNLKDEILRTRYYNKREKHFDRFNETFDKLMLRDVNNLITFEELKSFKKIGYSLITTLYQTGFYTEKDINNFRDISKYIIDKIYDIEKKKKDLENEYKQLNKGKKKEVTSEQQLLQQSQQEPQQTGQQEPTQKKEEQKETQELQQQGEQGQSKQEDKQEEQQQAGIDEQQQTGQQEREDGKEIDSQEEGQGQKDVDEQSLDEIEGVQEEDIDDKELEKKKEKDKKQVDELPPNTTILTDVILIDYTKEKHLINYIEHILNKYTSTLYNASREDTITNPNHFKKIALLPENLNVYLDKLFPNPNNDEGIKKKREELKKYIEDNILTEFNRRQTSYEYTEFKKIALNQEKSQLGYSALKLIEFLDSMSLYNIDDKLIDEALKFLNNFGDSRNNVKIAYLLNQVLQLTDEYVNDFIYNKFKTGTEEYYFDGLTRDSIYTRALENKDSIWEKVKEKFKELEKNEQEGYEAVLRVMSYIKVLPSYKDKALIGNQDITIAEFLERVFTNLKEDKKVADKYFDEVQEALSKKLNKEVEIIREIEQRRPKEPLKSINKNLRVVHGLLHHLTSKNIVNEFIDTEGANDDVSLVVNMMLQLSYDYEVTSIFYFEENNGKTELYTTTNRNVKYGSINGTLFLGAMSNALNKLLYNTEKKDIPIERPTVMIPTLPEPFRKVNEVKKVNFGSSEYDYTYEPKGLNNKNFDRHNRTRQLLLGNFLNKDSNGNKRIVERQIDKGGEIVKEYREGNVSVSMRLGYTKISLKDALADNSIYYEHFSSVPDLVKLRESDEYTVISEELDASKYKDLSYKVEEGEIDVPLKFFKVKTQDGTEKLVVLTKISKQGVRNYRAIEFSFEKDNKGEDRIVRKVGGYEFDLVVYLLEDLQKDENGRNYIFEIVNDAQVAREFHKHYDTLNKKEDVMIEVSINGYSDDSSFADVTTAKVRNVRGQKVANNDLKEKDLNKKDDDSSSMYDLQEEIDALEVEVENEKDESKKEELKISLENKTSAYNKLVDEKKKAKDVIDFPSLLYLNFDAPIVYDVVDSYYVYRANKTGRYNNTSYALTTLFGEPNNKNINLNKYSFKDRNEEFDFWKLLFSLQGAIGLNGSEYKRDLDIIYTNALVSNLIRELYTSIYKYHINNGRKLDYEEIEKQINKENLEEGRKKELNENLEFIKKLEEIIGNDNVDDFKILIKDLIKREIGKTQNKVVEENLNKAIDTIEKLSEGIGRGLKHLKEVTRIFNVVYTDNTGIDIGSDDLAKLIDGNLYYANKFNERRYRKVVDYVVEKDENQDNINTKLKYIQFTYASSYEAESDGKTQNIKNETFIYRDNSFISKLVTKILENNLLEESDEYVVTSRNTTKNSKDVFDNLQDTLEYRVSKNKFGGSRYLLDVKHNGNRNLLQVKGYNNKGLEYIVKTSVRDSDYSANAILIRELRNKFLNRYEQVVRQYLEFYREFVKENKITNLNASILYDAFYFDKLDDKIKKKLDSIIKDNLGDFIGFEEAVEKLFRVENGKYINQEILLNSLLLVNEVLGEEKNIDKLKRQYIRIHSLVNKINSLDIDYDETNGKNYLVNTLQKFYLTNVHLMIGANVYNNPITGNIENSYESRDKDTFIKMEYKKTNKDVGYYINDEKVETSKEDKENVLLKKHNLVSSNIAENIIQGGKGLDTNNEGGKEGGEGVDNKQVDNQGEDEKGDKGEIDEKLKDISKVIVPLSIKGIKEKLDKPSTIDFNDILSILDRTVLDENNRKEILNLYKSRLANNNFIFGEYRENDKDYNINSYFKNILNKREGDLQEEFKYNDKIRDEFKRISELHDGEFLRDLYIYINSNYGSVDKFFDYINDEIAKGNDVVSNIINDIKNSKDIYSTFINEKLDSNNDSNIKEAFKNIIEIASKQKDEQNKKLKELLGEIFDYNNKTIQYLFHLHLDLKSSFNLKFRNASLESTYITNKILNFENDELAKILISYNSYIKDINTEGNLLSSIKRINLQDNDINSTEHNVINSLNSIFNEVEVDIVWSKKIINDIEENIRINAINPANDRYEEIKEEVEKELFKIKQNEKLFNQTIIVLTELASENGIAEDDLNSIFNDLEIESPVIKKYDINTINKKTKKEINKEEIESIDDNKTQYNEENDGIETEESKYLEQNTKTPIYQEQKPADKITESVFSFFKINNHIKGDYVIINDLLNVIKDRIDGKQTNTNNIDYISKEKLSTLVTTNSKIGNTLLTLLSLKNLNRDDNKEFLKSLLKGINKGYDKFKDKGIKLDSITANVIYNLYSLYNSYEVYLENLNKLENLKNNNQEVSEELKKEIENYEKYMLPVIEALRNFRVNIYENDNLDVDDKNIYKIAFKEEKGYYVQAEITDRKVKESQFYHSITPFNKIQAMGLDSSYTNSLKRLNDIKHHLEKLSGKDRDFKLSKVIFNNLDKRLDTDLKDIDTGLRYYLYNKYKYGVHTVLNTSTIDTAYSIKIDDRSKLLSGSEGLYFEVMKIFDFLDSLHRQGVISNYSEISNEEGIFKGLCTPILLEYNNVTTPKSHSYISKLFEGYHFIYGTKQENGRNVKDTNNVILTDDVFDTKYHTDITFIDGDNVESSKKFLIPIFKKENNEIRLTELGYSLYNLYRNNKKNEQVNVEFKQKADKIKRIKKAEKLISQLQNDEFYNLLFDDIKIKFNFLDRKYINQSGVIKNILRDNIIKSINYINDLYYNDTINEETYNNLLETLSIVLNISKYDNNTIRRLDEFRKEKVNQEYINQILSYLSDIEQSNPYKEGYYVFLYLLSNRDSQYKPTLNKNENKNKNEKVELDKIKASDIKSNFNKLLKDLVTDKNEEVKDNWNRNVIDDFSFKEYVDYLVHNEAVTLGSYIQQGDMNIKIYKFNEDEGYVREKFHLNTYGKRKQQDYTSGTAYNISENLIERSELHINSKIKRLVVYDKKKIKLNEYYKDKRKDVSDRVVEVNAKDGQSEMLVDEFINIYAAKGVIDLSKLGYLKKSLYSFKHFHHLGLLRSVLQEYLPKKVYDEVIYTLATKSRYIEENELKDLMKDQYEFISSIYKFIIENRDKSSRELREIAQQKISYIVRLVGFLEDSEISTLERNQYIDFNATTINIQDVINNIKRDLSSETVDSRDKDKLEKLLEKLEKRYTELKEQKDIRKNKDLFSRIIDEMIEINERYDKLPEDIRGSVEQDVDGNSEEVKSLYNATYFISVLENLVNARKMGAYGNSDIHFSDGTKVEGQYFSLKSSFAPIYPVHMMEVEDELYRNILRHNHKAKQSESNDYISIVADTEAIKRFPVPPINKDDKDKNVSEKNVGFDAKIFIDMIDGKSSYENTTTPIGSKTTFLAGAFTDKISLQEKKLVLPERKKDKIEKILGDKDTKEIKSILDNLSIENTNKLLNNIGYLMSYKMYSTKLRSLGLDKQVLKFSDFFKLAIKGEEIPGVIDRDVEDILDDYKIYENYYNSFKSVLKPLKEMVNTSIIKVDELGYLLPDDMFDVVLNLLDAEQQQIEDFLNDGKLGGYVVEDENNRKNIVSQLQKCKSELIKLHMDASFMESTEIIDNNISFISFYDSIINKLTKRLIKDSVHLNVNGGFEVNFSMTEGIKYKSLMTFTEEFMEEVVEDYRYYKQLNDKDFKDNRKTEEIFDELTSEELYDIILKNRDGKYTDIVFVSNNFKIGDNGYNNILAGGATNGQLESIVGITIRIPQAGRETQSPARIVGVYPTFISGVASSHPYTVHYKGEDFDFDKLDLQINYVPRNEKHRERIKELFKKISSKENIQELLLDDDLLNKTNINDIMTLYSIITYMVHVSDNHMESVKSGTTYGAFETEAQKEIEKISEDYKSKSFDDMPILAEENTVSASGLGMAVLFSSMIARAFYSKQLVDDVAKITDIKELLDTYYYKLYADTNYNEIFDRYITKESFLAVSSLLQVCVDAQKLLANSALGMKKEYYMTYLYFMLNRELLANISNVDVKEMNRDKIIETLIEHVIKNKNLLKLIDLYDDIIKKKNGVIYYKGDDDKYKQYTYDYNDEKQIYKDTKKALKEDPTQVDYVVEFINKLENLEVHTEGVGKNQKFVIFSSSITARDLDNFKYVIEFIGNISNGISKLNSIYNEFSIRRPNIIDNTTVSNVFTEEINKDNTSIVYDLAMFNTIKDTPVLQIFYEDKLKLLSNIQNNYNYQKVVTSYKYVATINKSFRQLMAYKMLRDYIPSNLKSESRPISVITGTILDEDILNGFLDNLLSTVIKVGDREYRLSDYISIDKNKDEPVLKVEYSNKDKVVFTFDTIVNTNHNTIKAKRGLDSKMVLRMNSLLDMILFSGEYDNELLKNIKINEKEKSEILNYLKRLVLAQLYIKNEKEVSFKMVANRLGMKVFNENDKRVLNGLIFTNLGNAIKYNVSNQSMLYQYDVNGDTKIALKKFLEKFKDKSKIDLYDTDFEIDSNGYIRTTSKVYGGKKFDKPIYISRDTPAPDIKAKDFILNKINGIKKVSDNYNQKSERIIELLESLKYIDELGSKRSYIEDILAHIKSNLNIIDFGFDIEILDSDSVVAQFDAKNRKIILSTKVINEVDKYGMDIFEEFLHAMTRTQFKIDKSLEEDIRDIKESMKNNLKVVFGEQSNELVNLLFSTKGIEEIADMIDKYSNTEGFDEVFKKICQINNLRTDGINRMKVIKAMKYIAYANTRNEEFYPNLLNAIDIFSFILRDSAIKNIKDIVNENIDLNLSNIKKIINNKSKHYLMRHGKKLFNRETHKNVLNLMDNLGLYNGKTIC